MKTSMGPWSSRQVFEVSEAERFKLLLLRQGALPEVVEMAEGIAESLLVVLKEIYYVQRAYDACEMHPRHLELLEQWEIEFQNAIYDIVGLWRGKGCVTSAAEEIHSTWQQGEMLVFIYLATWLSEEGIVLKRRPRKVKVDVASSLVGTEVSTNSGRDWM